MYFYGKNSRDISTQQTTVIMYSTRCQTDADLSWQFVCVLTAGWNKQSETEQTGWVEKSKLLYCDIYFKG